ncbi:MAG: DUF86 domain-containing protein [Dehalococcoidia bacterium]
MSYTPSDAETIWDIVVAARGVLRYVQETDRTQFSGDEMRQDAVIRRLEVIGEAARRLSDDFRSSHPEAPWRSIIGMRNALIHLYDEVNLDEVWRVATEDVPRLIALLEPLLPEPGEDA